ncbi:MAG TPA: hypothetical protein ENI77_04815 [Nitrospirae bacterium]|nr:hypothetical protein [Nitrospirota bacterium]
MNYVGFVNQELKKALKDKKGVIVFGQNVGTGSCVSGLSRGIEKETGCRVLNTQNSENTLVGAGFGMMRNGVSSIYIMKQLDFLLLGIDQLVNTYNYIRVFKPSASFTILAVVVDNGYQGMQSSLNNLADFCSIARIPGYAITNRRDAEKIIGAHLVSPGFRIIGLSQRLFGRELIDFEQVISCEADGGWLQYTDGADVTIACFNFSIPQGRGLIEALKDKGKEASLFSINSSSPVEWSPIIANACQTGAIVVIDDIKSVNSPSVDLVARARGEEKIRTITHITRDFSSLDWLRPNADELVLNNKNIIHQALK